MRLGRRPGRAAAILVAVVALATGCSSGPDLLEVPAQWSTPGPGADAAPTGDAAQTLAALPVKGRAPRTGYDRDQFGQRWADVDRDGCDQRNQVLARDLVDETFRGGSTCVVITGLLRDPYTGSEIAFTRGEDTSDDVQIDHVVPLSNSWQTGAQQLDAAARRLFANDPLNLLAVEGAVNQSKGDGDAATWLPPARSFRCAYVARQVAVKSKYRLWVTAAERDAIARILGDCPGEPLPTDPSMTVAGGRSFLRLARQRPQSRGRVPFTVARNSGVTIRGIRSPIGDDAARALRDGLPPAGR